MSTRATIEIKDRWSSYFVYRHCDGFPEIILADINEAIDKFSGRMSGSAIGQFVSLFLGMHFDMKQRVQDYELTTSRHGDESYLYLIKWVDSDKKYIAEVIE